MRETAFFWLPLQRLYRQLSSLTQSSWILILTYLGVFAVIAIGFFRLGQSNFSQSNTLLALGSIFAYLAGMWIGYSYVNGYRPVTWRLIPKTAWSYIQSSSLLSRVIILELITLTSFYLGANWANTVTWWSIVLLISSSLLLFLGLISLGIGIALLIKNLSHNYLIRAVLVITSLYLFLAICQYLTPVFQSIDSAWRFTSLNDGLTTLFFCIGIFGIAVALLELVLPGHHIQTKQPTRYWQLKLPSRGMGHFGPGTAVFASEILYYLRSTRIQRAFIFAIVLTLIGLILINAFSPIYRSDAQTLFYTLVTLLGGYLATVISFTTGYKAENNLEEFRTFPVSPAKVGSAYYFASFISVLVVTALLVELFLVGVMSIEQIALTIEVSLLTSLVAFEFGRSAYQLKSQTGDQLTRKALFTTVIVLVVINSGIVLLFDGKIHTLTTSLMIFLWSAGAWLLARRSYLAPTP